MFYQDAESNFYLELSKNGLVRRKSRAEHPCCVFGFQYIPCLIKSTH